MNVKHAIADFLQEEEGLTVVEYAIAGGLISLAVVGAFQALGGKVGDVIQALADLIPTP